LKKASGQNDTELIEISEFDNEGFYSPNYEKIVNNEE
jgi:hypothetical protein